MRSPVGRAQAGVAGMQWLDLHRDVVLELRAVGGVQVYGGDGVPLRHQPQHGLHLGRIGLQVVAVEVEVLRRGAPAHLLRAALVGTVPGAKALVAVHVEHRHEHQHLALERARRGGSFQHLAEREEAGILAVDLAGVDAPWTSSTGSLAARAAAGVSAPLREATSTFIGRPSGVVPKSPQRTASGQRAAKASQSAGTSS